MEGRRSQAHRAAPIMPGDPRHSERLRRSTDDPRADARTESEDTDRRANLRLIRSQRTSRRRQPLGSESEDAQFEKKWAIYYVPVLFLLLVWIVFVAIAHEL